MKNKIVILLLILISIFTFALKDRVIKKTLSDRIYDPDFNFSFKIPFVYRTTIDKTKQKHDVVYNIKQTSTDIVIKVKRIDDVISLEYLDDLYWIPVRDSISDIEILSIDDVQKDTISGRRYEFEYYKDKRKMRVFLYYFIKDNVFYEIRCESPERLIKNNNKLFSFFLKKLEIE